MTHQDMQVLGVFCDELLPHCQLLQHCAASAVPWVCIRHRKHAEAHSVEALLAAVADNDGVRAAFHPTANAYCILHLGHWHRPVGLP